MDFVYILKCSDNTYYTGWTCHPQKRLETHNSGKGAKYTRCRLPAELVYLELLPDKSQALKREYAIKKLIRPDKDKLVELYKKHTFNYNSFTPIRWVSQPADDYTDTTIFSVPLNISQYPLKLSQREKISKIKTYNSKNKENLKD